MKKETMNNYSSDNSSDNSRLALYTIMTITAFIMLSAAQVYCMDIPATNPKLGVEGNTVTMQMDITGGTVAKEVKILFKGQNIASFTEFSEIQSYYEWYVNSETGKTTVAKMYQEGWRLVHIIPFNSTGAKQFFLVFER